ncbi:MAG: hypothetical protein EBW69_06095, partial [Nitrosomonadales bacterium]|nr:hypothetical protein [Nitrosomonadales bacterium]
KKIDRLECISINPIDDIDKKKYLISQTINRIDSGDGVIIFTDIIGATPCNILKEFIVENKVSVLTGVNLAMIIKALSSKNKPLESIIQESLDSALDNILKVSQDD